MDFPGFALDLSALQQTRRPEPQVLYDVLILGGGPAAASAAIYAARKMLTLAVIAKDLGGQITSTSEIENYAGFQSITGRELAERLADHVRRFDVPIAEGETVTEVRREGPGFEVLLASGERYRGKTVILATGKRHRHLNVPGEAELAGRGVAYCAICDAPFYRDRRVVVAGGGNSALTAALDLLKVNAEVTVVNFAAGWQADPVLRHAVERQGKARLLDEHAVVRIEGQDRVTAVAVRPRTSEREEVIPADGIFIEIGLSPNSEPVGQLAKLTPARELIVDCACRTSVEGLFGAGDVTTVPYNQIVISAGEGAKAALSAYEHLIQTGAL